MTTTQNTTELITKLEKAFEQVKGSNTNKLLHSIIAELEKVERYESLVNDLAKATRNVTGEMNMLILRAERLTPITHE